MSATGFADKVESQIIARDLGACARCGRHVVHLERGVAWAIHHRRPRGAGGTVIVWVNLAANGIVLCTACHEHIESHRAEARMAGYLVPLNGVLKADEVAIRHHTLGLVYLNDEGGWAPVEEGPTPDSWGGEAA